ncbi:MAG: hypothetical protein M1835_004328 [Candelina submexicana]|nr:MAG: hypothetical protein M1835_004328 [Candelina submexicana]
MFRLHAVDISTLRGAENYVDKLTEKPTLLADNCVEDGDAEYVGREAGSSSSRGSSVLTNDGLNSEEQNEEPDSSDTQPTSVGSSGDDGYSTLHEKKEHSILNTSPPDHNILFLSTPDKQVSNNGGEYFHLECCYVNFNGKAFGETSIKIAILKFRGTKRINTLEAFPLEYHPNKIEVKANLIECGRKFVSFDGRSPSSIPRRRLLHAQGQPIKVPVNSRIIIDAVFFQEAKDGAWIISMSDDRAMKKKDLVKSNGKDPAEVDEDDLIC